MRNTALLVMVEELLAAVMDGDHDAARVALAVVPTPALRGLARCLDEAAAMMAEAADLYDP